MSHPTKKIRFSLFLSMCLIFLAILCALINKCDFSDEDKNIFTSESEDVQILSSDEEFESYVNDLFRQEASASALSLHYTLENPENYDIFEYNTDLGEYSIETSRISAALAENIRSSLEKFNRDSLSVENQLTLDILTDALETTIVAATFPYYEEPLRPSTGTQAELPILLAEYSFRDVQDINTYLEILESIPTYFDSICQYEQEKSDRGLFMSDFAADTIISQCTDFAASADANYLIYTFEEKIDGLEGLAKNEAAAYKKQNQAIVSGQVLPAFQKIADTLTEIKTTSSSTTETNKKEVETTSAPTGEETAGAARNDAGLCQFDRGTEYYEFLVKQATGSNDSVEDLQKRVEEKRTADLTAATLLIESTPNLEEELLAADAPCDTPDEMLTLLQQEIGEDFPSITNCNYTIKYVDTSMEEYLAPAFYLTSPLDHFTENSIYINNGNGYHGLQLFTTLAHEGYPGHLYQNAAFCNTDPSPIRILFGPAGYTEGWATYVEMLAYHYAGLSENVAEALALEQAAILSLYASADMGIHHDRWSFTDTCDFFSGYGFTDEATIREIYELIVEEPAHYLKYYIGYLEFLSLKDYAKETYGSDYSDLEFHRAVLEIGPAPFSILKKYFPDYYHTE